MKQKTQNILLITFTTVILLGAIALWLAPTIAINYFSNSFIRTDENTLDASISPDGNKKVIVKYGREPFIFGSSGVEVFTQIKGEKEKHWQSLEIANDGSALFADRNVHIEWKENTAILTLSGAEQEDAVYEIEFEEK